MSQVSKVQLYFQENPAGCWVKFLEFSVKLVSYVLAGAGVSMLALSIIVAVQIHTLHRSPWFVYAFGSAGLVTLVISLAALLGSSRRSAHCLNCNVVGMLLGLTIQACLATAYFLDHSWEKHLPPDEQFDKLKAFIKHNLQVFKWVGLSILALQVLGLFLTCALQSIYVRAEEHVEDEEEDAVWRRRALLQGQAGLPDNTADAVGQPRTDEWTKRMRERYNLDTSRFSYDPAKRNSRTHAAEHNTPVSRQQRCTVM